MNIFNSTLLFTFAAAKVIQKYGTDKKQVRFGQKKTSQDISRGKRLLKQQIYDIYKSAYYKMQYP